MLSILEKKKSLNFSDKTLYYIFYLFKSTGFIITIFPIFLNEIIKLDVSEIIKIASYFAFIPFFFEIPTGFLSDTWGDRKVVFLGLVLMILAIIGITFFPFKITYYLYLGLISLAGNCFSGAEDVLLRNILTSEEEYFKVKSDLSSKFYLFSTSFLILGGVSYLLNPFITFYFQILSLLISIYALWRLKENKNHISTNKLDIKKQIIDLKMVTSHLMDEKSFILISLITGWFSSVVLLNNRTVQLQFLKIIGSNAPLYITLFFCLGNFFSSQGSNFIKKYVNKISNPIFYLTCLVSFSYLLFSFNNLFLTAIAFIILCFFKGAYRPYLNSKLMESIPIKSLRATFLSISALLGAVISFFVQYIYGSFFSDIFKKNSLVVVLTLLFCSILMFILYRKSLVKVSSTN